MRKKQVYIKYIKYRCVGCICIYIYVYIYIIIYIVTYINIYIGFKPSVSRGKLAQRSLWNRQRKLTCFKPFLTWILRKGSGTYYKKNIKYWCYIFYMYLFDLLKFRDCLNGEGTKKWPSFGPPKLAWIEAFDLANVQAFKRKISGKAAAVSIIWDDWDV